MDNRLKERDVNGRVVRNDRGSMLVLAENKVGRAKVSTRLIKNAKNNSELPVVGDWLVVRLDEAGEQAIVEEVLPRTGAITRGDPGKTAEVQVLAANIDIVFIVQPIEQGPNLRRIERELSIAWESGAQPVIVLTKADLCDNPIAALEEVEEIAFGIDILMVNGLKSEDLEPIKDKIKDGKTAVLIGPSGAGKSTIINCLLGEKNRQPKKCV